MHRLFYRLITLALVVLFALPALGQYTRDAAANRKIDEAINTHYLATDFDKAEAVLTGTIKACEDKCSPQTLAKAWMYVGIVRGSGRNDQAGAREAFQSALALDPNVKLDAGLATPETQTSFAGASTGAPAAPAAAAAPSEPAAPAAEPQAQGQAQAAQGLVCTPSVTEVETRRPVPVECQTDESVTAIELRYKAFGSESWKTLHMQRKGQSYRAQIPCDATMDAGTLRFYVRGKSAQGEEVANWGTKNQPNEITLVEQSTAEPPSFEDADAPARCAAKEICPPDFPGCDSGKKSGGTVDWGGSCENSSECKSGLLCIDGTCETAPSCTTNSDCPAGTCVDGKCAVSGEEGTSGGPAKKWWIGLHIAQDIAFVGGDHICDQSSPDPYFACYFSGSSDITYDPGPGGFDTQAVGRVPTGTVRATTRILLSLDRVLSSHITAGLRLGYAFGGGPPANRVAPPVVENGTYVAGPVVSEGKAFLPFHAEVRAAYWFGNNPFGKAGFKGYVHAGGGLAQVDARVSVNVNDKDGSGTVDAWKKLGQGFITIGGGAVYGFTPKLGLQLNLNAMYMLSASGLVLQPSLGMIYGF